jgi:TolB-like protein/tetratricopeptide (TPR) repeat protein
VLADFGIARAIDAAGSERLTATGLAVGTPAYMSPEQAGAERTLDGRSDLYSLGCVAYEMLGGDPPFTGRSPQVILARHSVDPVPPLRTLRPNLPAGVERAIERALAKVPADRFATVEEFAEALRLASTPEAVAAEARGTRGWSPGRVGAAAAAVVLLLAAGAWWARSHAHGPGIERFAVLPFTSLTADTTREYLVEGLYDGLISELQGEGLGVIARTSVMQYRNSDKPARTIARELGVDALVESSVTETADSVTVQARLVDGRTEEYLWSLTYGADLGHVSALPRELGLGIARHISPGTVPAAAARGTRAMDPEAYDAVLKGWFHLHKPGRTELENALRYFELAIAKDSNYAVAWAGVSEVWTVSRQRGYESPAVATPKANAAVARALALDSTLAEPHIALAGAKMYGAWDWDGAEREFRTGIRLKPDDPEAHVFYAHLLCILGHRAEAIQEGQRARALDPLDPAVQWLYGAVLTVLGRFDEAIAQYRDALTRSPESPPILWLLWVALNDKGANDEALLTARRWAGATRDQELRDSLDRGNARGGYAGAMRAVANLEADRSQRRYVSSWDIAIWYAAAGLDDEALTWLERAYQTHDPTMPYLAVHPSWKRLHGNPRFRDLVRRLKLPAALPAAAS